GLRVSDLIPLKVSDVMTNHLHIVPRKNKKSRLVKISHFSHITNRYTYKIKVSDYLFHSRKGNSFITSNKVYYSFFKAVHMVDRNDIETHTMSKTIGYHHYKQNKDIAALQEIFSHTTPEVTKRYIGITQEEIDDSINFVL